MVERDDIPEDQVKAAMAHEAKILIDSHVHLDRIKKYVSGDGNPRRERPFENIFAFPVLSTERGGLSFARF